MSTRGRALALLAILSFTVALFANLAAKSQGRPVPSRPRTPTYSDMLRRYQDKLCDLRELPVPGTERNVLVLRFDASPPDKAASDRLTLAQIGDDFVVLSTDAGQKLYLPHGMVALFEKE